MNEEFSVYQTDLSNYPILINVSYSKISKRLSSKSQPYVLDNACAEFLNQPLSFSFSCSLTWEAGLSSSASSMIFTYFKQTVRLRAPRNQSDVFCDVSWIWLTSSLLNLQLAPNYIQKTCWIHLNPLRSALSTQRWRRRRSATLTLVVQAAAEHGPHVPRSRPSEGTWTLETQQKHNRAEVFDRSLLHNIYIYLCIILNIYIYTPNKDLIHPDTTFASNNKYFSFAVLQESSNHLRYGLPRCSIMARSIRPGHKENLQLAESRSCNVA